VSGKMQTKPNNLTMPGDVQSIRTQECPIYYYLTFHGHDHRHIFRVMVAFEIDCHQRDPACKFLLILKTGFMLIKIRHKNSDKTRKTGFYRVIRATKLNQIFPRCN